VARKKVDLSDIPRVEEVARQSSHIWEGLYRTSARMPGGETCGFGPCDAWNNVLFGMRVCHRCRQVETVDSEAAKAWICEVLGDDWWIRWRTAITMEPYLLWLQKFNKENASWLKSS
jgi:hypothetical protein